MTISKALSLGTSVLRSRATPALDSELLLASVLDLGRGSVLAYPERRLGLPRTLRYGAKLWQRRHGAPLAYLTNTQEFYGHSFHLTRATLIPRPDTETLIDTAIGALRANNYISTAIDIGTGSGCIAISLALALPQTRIIATDISSAALRVARHNRLRHGIANRITFLKGNLLHPLLLTTYYPLLSNALIVANLPYLTEREIVGELTFEPRLALDGGKDGLQAYATLLAQLHSLPEAARPKLLLLEVHPPTLEELLRLLKNIFPKSQVEIRNDLAGRSRVIVVHLAKNP